MPDFKRTTMASRAYDKAHEAHYATKDLHHALELYKGVMAEHPDTQEAECTPVLGKSSSRSSRRDWRTLSSSSTRNTRNSDFAVTWSLNAASPTVG